MNRPRLAGLRREVGEWRESGFRALIEPPEMELETLNLNNLKGHMAPSSSSSRKRPLEEPDELAQAGEGTIAAAERPALKSRKQD